MNASLLRKLTIAVTMVAAVSAQARILTVGKEVPAMFTTVQAAVNEAQRGDIIEIQDVAVYEEQVTIDGRDKSPWAGVEGGKIGITIRAKNPMATVKPVIRYRDITNTSPRRSAEAFVPGELPGMAGNFETSAAIRVLSARGVTIDGIAIDGGAAYPFGAPSVWCARPDMYGCPAHFHGNAGISIVNSGDATVTNCQIRNAYFGVYVKDRNNGGVFANRNPDDIDYVVPLVTFGRAGNHLFEHNRVHNNSVGFYFESLWDLSSTVRYNLIYNNVHTAATRSALGSLPEPPNRNDGGFLFKDAYLAPIVIYNNTLYNNTSNFIGDWQSGGQHLIFNNIFSKFDPYGPGSGTTSSSIGSYWLSIDENFPNRMHNSVFSAPVGTSLSSGIQLQCQSNFDCPENSQYIMGRGCYIYSVRMMTWNIPSRAISITYCYPGSSVIGTQPVQMVLPGSLITGGGSSSYAPPVPTSANLRWLQMEGGNIPTGGGVSGSLPNLFKSLDPTNVHDFLVPDRSHQHVQDFIINKGWMGIGIRNSDGSHADLGAIPSTGTFPVTLARIKPADVVKINGTSAEVSFNLTVERGTFNNPRINFLRWISPIPISTGEMGSQITAIPAGSISNIVPPTTPATPGHNTMTFTIPRLLTAADTYGFFEMVLHGTDANGNPVTSDVGILPYRRLDTQFELAFFPSTGSMSSVTRLTSVDVNTPVRLSVNAASVGSGFDGTLNSLEFVSMSGLDLNMYRVDNDSPFTFDSDVATPAVYDVYFKEAGYESILATATAGSLSERQAFTGSVGIQVIGSLTLTYASGENGSVTGALSQTVTIGESGTEVVAVPDDGYVFAGWSDGVPTASRTDVSVTRSVNATAVFVDENELQQREIKYSAGSGGTVVGVLEQRIISGRTGTQVEAIPDEGYTFTSWSDGVTSAVRIDDFPENSFSVTANFARIQYTLSYNTGESGRLLGATGFLGATHTVTLNSGEDGPELTAFPNFGYTFHQWSDGLETAERQDLDVQSDISVSAYFMDEDGNVSVNSGGRVVVRVDDGEAALILPAAVLGGGFTAGPNPVGGSSGAVNFFYDGGAVRGGVLTVYDATGRVVNKIKIDDNANRRDAMHCVSTSGTRRVVGAWDLRDRRGRPVADGAYLVRGDVKLMGGGRERVSVILGVR